MGLIKLENIQKSFGANTISYSQNFELKERTSYQLTGANGCGKTTLLKMMCGLLVPDFGTVSLNDETGWCSSKGVGLFPRLTGQENINLFKTLLRLKNTDSRLDSWRRLESFSQGLEQEVGKCSDGMKMLISLYISQLSSPKLVAWDEPFAHLSINNTSLILSDLENYIGQATLIFSSHEKLESFSGEVIAL